MCVQGEKMPFLVYISLKISHSNKCINFDVKMYSDEWVWLCALHASDTVINPRCWNCNGPLYSTLVNSC